MGTIPPFDIDLKGDDSVVDVIKNYLDDMFKLLWGYLSPEELPGAYAHAAARFVSLENLIQTMSGPAGLVLSSTEPATPADGLIWVDLSQNPPLIKFWDQSNSQWITLFDLVNDLTVGGTATYLNIPVLPAIDPTTDNQAARKGYVDAQIAASKSPIRYTKNGLLTVQNGMAYIPASVAATISKVRVAVVTAPSGGPFSLRLRRNGTSDIFAATTLSISSGTYSAETTSLQNNSLIASDWLRPDVSAANGAEDIMLTIYF